MSILLALQVALPLKAADTLRVQYSFLSLELPVADLEAYATKGERSPLLNSYLRGLNPTQLEDLRRTLNQSLHIPPQVLARFLSTSSGYRFLEDLSQLVQADAPEMDSVIALRTAIILTAAQEESITLLGLLRHFPAAGVRVDVQEGLRLFKLLQRATADQQQVKQEIKQRSLDATASIRPLLPSQVQALTQVGPFRWQTRSLQLQDSSSERLQFSGSVRSLPLDLYLPHRGDPAPVLILSHGLGAGRTSHTYLAEHLASYGYAVIIPEHLGSSVAYWRALLKSELSEISRPQEFIDRPLDIQFILDELTRRSHLDPQLKGRLNLNQVGIIGHSFGGYTALVNAGGQLDLPQLRQTCQQGSLQAFNPSLLLQCQAAAISVPLPKLSEPRVKAVMVVNPISSALFGPTGLENIQIPLLMVAGGTDYIAPLAQEQWAAFQQLSSPHQHLLLLDQANHFSSIGDLSAQDALLNGPAGSPETISRKTRVVLRAIALSFFATYLPVQSNPPVFSLPVTVKSLNQPDLSVFGVTIRPQKEYSLTHVK
ncbi:alpha/beta hydrolase [Lyngbya confervoides]|uniref:Alpha/beta hydrolase n=1 Tax=Lyngbya confervoides BDU141951 TaxID=1574623 RepID=A0ABD4T0L2_9CYAN|nr:alpha/beta hydrolase [Lyngbya confervoides]MCM1981956.1 alpha/beta hydrolase [Lyngbya confervoides BDU141951]